MNIFISEIKRQFTAKRFISYIGVAMALALFWSWFIIGGARSGFLGTNLYKGLNGAEAINASNKDRNVYFGKMTEDTFERSGEIFLDSIDDKGEIEMNDKLLKTVDYVDTLLIQDYNLKDISGEVPTSIKELPDNFGYNFYENENLYYKNLINVSTKNQAEKDLAYKMWSVVQKPYTYYGGFGVWSEAIEHIPLLGFILLTMVAFFSSGIISKDKDSGLDEIISTTKGGRSKLLVAKIFIPIIMGTLIYIVGIGLYISILKHILPTDTLKTSVQLVTPSVLPYSLGEVMRIMIGFGLIGTITISVFSTLISSKSNKASVSMSIMVMILLVGFILSYMMDLNNSILEYINLFLPGSVMFSYLKFTKVPIVTVLGKAILTLNLSLLTTIIILIISLVIVCWGYVRR